MVTRVARGVQPTCEAGLEDGGGQQGVPGPSYAALLVPLCQTCLQAVWISVHELRQDATPPRPASTRADVCMTSVLTHHCRTPGTGCSDVMRHRMLLSISTTKW
jgi:hypothetical protein